MPLALGMERRKTFKSFNNEEHGEEESPMLMQGNDFFLTLMHMPMIFSFILFSRSVRVRFRGPGLVRVPPLQHHLPPPRRQGQAGALVQGEALGKASLHV